MIGLSHIYQLAPLKYISAKESGCGCAGVFTAHAAVELYCEAEHATITASSPASLLTPYTD